MILTDWVRNGPLVEVWKDTELVAVFTDKDVEAMKKELVKSDGGATSYYELPPHATELRHLISHKGMSKSRGDVFKACYRLGEKDGADILYDLKKMRFFIDDMIEMYERGERI